MIKYLQSEWIKDNCHPEDIMQCTECSRLVDGGWIHPDLDHKGLCGVCLAIDCQKNEGAESLNNLA